MKDYRLPRTSSHRAARRSTPARRTPTKSSSWLGKLLKWPLKILALTLGLILIGWMIVRLVLPQFMPLTRNTNIVFVSLEKDLNINKIVIAQFRPETQTLDIIELQNDQPVSVIGGFGDYPLRSVYPLLDLEKKDGLFKRGAFSFVTGQVIDGVVALPTQQLPTTPNQIGAALQFLPGQRTESSLPEWQLLQLLFFTLKIPADRVTFTATGNDQEWSAYRQRLAVKYPEDDCSVAVVNTTTKGGLAREMSAIIEQTGYTVVRITDTATRAPRTTITYDPNQVECLAQAKRLGNLFPLAVDINSDANLSASYRAKVVISLGEDVSQLR